MTLPVGGVGRLRKLAHDAAPAECCGVLVGSRGAVEAILPVANVASRGRFEMDPDELLAILTAADDDGTDVVGTFHSHPGGRAEPSAVDVEAAVGGWVMVIVGRRGVRAWSIGPTGAAEVPIVERTW